MARMQKKMSSIFKYTSFKILFLISLIIIIISTLVFLGQKKTIVPAEKVINLPINKKSH